MDPARIVDVTTEEQLRELIGHPQPRTRDKARSVLHEHHREWLAHSPFCLIATSAADGTCDVSPKGDPAGFVQVLDERTVAIPERAGNRRADGFLNLLSNPHIGLIHLVPGRGDTLRINGRARIVADAPFFDDMVVAGHRPRLAVIVTVEQVFFHCSKAFLRSKLWKQETWDPQALPSRPRIAQALERPEDSLEVLEEYYGPKYAEGLYPTVS
jgi:uncharacterized protein